MNNPGKLYGVPRYEHPNPVVSNPYSIGIVVSFQFLHLPDII